ncbi:MAG: DNA ligase [Parcubacteria bacterium 32_520]|nr:MAG: DNA ligase [Parcubacteria bacterium 32_520]
MTKKDENRIKQLRELINYYRHLYHTEDKEEISSEALDSLKKELFDLEEKYPQFVTKDSPTQRIGGKPLEYFEKVKRENIMYSFNDAFSREDMDNWEKRNQKLLPADYSYYCEPKLDGLAIELVYENGILVLGSTRGDGLVGENVTQNIKTIESIPLKLKGDYPQHLIVRGEAIINKKEFERINKDRDVPYANARNLAAGSIRQLDPRVTAQRKLDANIYSIVTDLGQKTHQEEHQLLESFGFKTTNKYNKLCKNMDEVFDFYYYWQDHRVAILKPVNINGVTITRATLHNQEEIERLGLKIGDTVVVGRAGDVIPEISKVFPELRTGKEKAFKMISNCPSCGSDLVKKEGEVVWRCPNTECFKRKIGWFKHFVSREAFNIEGIGPKALEKFIEEGLVSIPSDLFELKEGDILPLERFAQKSAQKIIENIQKRKNIPFSRFIYSLGIRNVGQKTSHNLAKRFKTIEEIKNTSKEELESIGDIGPVVSESIVEWFSKKENEFFLNELKNNGVRYFSEEQKSNKLSGKKFVITGTMKELSRELAKEKIVSLGGEVYSAVSKNVDYLVVGENPGSKYNKAIELGIKIINEDDFLKMIK